MSLLRKAELTDFPTYKQLFEDKNEDIGYQWLYYNYLSDDIRREPTEEEEAEFKRVWGDLSEFTKYFENYTIEKFERDLEIGQIYMIQRDDKILGYISMYYHEKGRYKIAEWAMYNPKDDETKREIIEELKRLKLPRLREYHICVIDDNVIKFLLSNGFVQNSPKVTSFYKLEVKK